MAFIYLLYISAFLKKSVFISVPRYSSYECCDDVELPVVGCECLELKKAM